MKIISNILHAQGLGLILDSFQSSKGREVNKLPPPVVGKHIF